MSIYIHIPFCQEICSYCDFSKFYYNEKWADNYLIELEKEIKKNYQNEAINTIYIGGGTPTSLNYDQLKKLLDITVLFKKNKEIEFTIETNVNLDVDKIKLLKEYGVNRVSIGVETLNKNHLKFLNRKHTKEEVLNLVNNLKINGIYNINIDLIYALPNQTLNQLKKDLNFFLSLDIPHISTYSLIIEPHTKLYINNIANIDEDLDYKMYQLIEKTLKKNNFKHYEISNFAKEGYESKHNLVYWNNLNYYGFGIGASGYINNLRYENTKSYSDYIKGKYSLEKHKLSLNETIENEFILGFRKLDGININDFKTKYNMDIFSIEIVRKLLKENKLVLNNDSLKINPEYIYISNTILVDFIDLDINMI